MTNGTLVGTCGPGSFFLLVHANVLIQFNICILTLYPFLVCQSVDNELVLWEPKIKEQSPGEVRRVLLEFSCLYLCYCRFPLILKKMTVNKRYMIPFRAQSTSFRSILFLIVIFGSSSFPVISNTKQLL